MIDTIFLKWATQKGRPLRLILNDLTGIGKNTSAKYFNNMGIQNTFKYGRLVKKTQNSIIEDIQNSKILLENDLKKYNKTRITSLITIRSYRGQRHILNLPVRGQRTKTNARTQKNHKPKNESMRTSYRYQSPNAKAKHKELCLKSTNYNIEDDDRGRKRKTI